MARPIWSGSITFGLVTIPVRLYAATEDHTVHFHQFERGTSDRVRYRRVNERTGKEVEFADIVKGYDLGDGDYVLLEQDELNELAPRRSRSIDIERFVRLDDIDPIHFQRTYWLAPAKPDYARPYALLAGAMRQTNRVGIALFVLRGKEYLTALRPWDGVLAVQTMLFADEIRDPAELSDEFAVSAADRESGDKGKGRDKGKELEMAVGLIDSMTSAWRPADFRDTYTERVRQLVADKRAGRETVSREPRRREPTDVVDLTEALRRSIESKRPKKSVASEQNLAKLSKVELARMARELNVSGRSKMSRDELQHAVAEAS